MKTKNTPPPLMYKGFLYKDGIYTNLSTGDCINIKVNAKNLTNILMLIDLYKH